MGRILDSVAAFFEEVDWPCTVLEESEPRMLTLAFQGEHAQWQCLGQIREALNQFLFYSICPIHVPAVQQPAVAEFIAHVNFLLAIGNFELSAAEGQVRFRTGIEVGDHALDAALLAPVVLINVASMDQHLPQLLAVIIGSLSPAEALAKTESLLHA
jgi:hypothetical protein